VVLQQGGEGLSDNGLPAGSLGVWFLQVVENA